MTITIRRAALSDAAALAGLRWAWHAEADQADIHDRREFDAAFGDWMAANLATHTAFIAEDGEEAIGMAWLAQAARVPEPGSLRRCAGDLQSVYVMPTRRNQGLGGALISTVLDHARAIALDRITVRAGRRSLPLYLRLGFASHEQLLDLEL